MSLWEYANPVKFMRLSGAVLPWVSGMSGVFYLCGALVLALSDYCAQRLFMPYQLPVGVMTVSLGGIYLIGLLIQESRKK